MSYADDLFGKIGTGRENAIERPSRASTDRRLRSLISDANMRGDFIIPSNTGGYYRPDMTRPEELAEANLYVRMEQARISNLVRKERKMLETFRGKRASAS